MSDVTTDLTTSHGLAEHIDEVQVIDCREPYEWHAGRIEGSIHLPLNSILAGATGHQDPGRDDRPAGPGEDDGGRVPLGQPQRARHAHAPGPRLPSVQPRPRARGVGE